MNFVWPDNIKNFGMYIQRNFAIPVQKEEKGETILSLGSHPSTCRDSLVNYFEGLRNSKYVWHGRQSVPKDFSLPTDKTVLFIIDDKWDLKNIEKEIHKLHGLEHSFGLALTSFEFIEVKGSKLTHKGVMFISDPVWSTNLWKYSLYSYLIKKLVYNATEYDKSLRPVFHKFMNHLTKTFKEEFRLNDTQYAYSFCGFKNIADGVNKPMHELLIKQEPKDE